MFVNVMVSFSNNCSKFYLISKYLNFFFTASINYKYHLKYQSFFLNFNEFLISIKFDHPIILNNLLV